MKQETTKHSNYTLSNISFQQKSTALTLIIISIVAMYYFANVWLMLPVALANQAIPAGFGSLVLTTLILMIVSEIVLQIVLVIGAGSAPAATETEQVAALKAKRNAYFVLTAGVLTAVGSVLLAEPNLFLTANLALLGLVFAEIVKFTSQLLYARR
jgi:hypothetical protein